MSSTARLDRYRLARRRSETPPTRDEMARFERELVRLLADAAERRARMAV